MKQLKSQELIEKIIFGSMGFDGQILKNENGKPYIKDNPIFFNCTNTESFSAIAVGKSALGIDAEKIGRKKKEELLRWVAYESYIKFLGGSIFSEYKKLSFDGENIFYCGSPVGKPRFKEINGYIISVFSEKEDFSLLSLDGK